MQAQSPKGGGDQVQALTEQLAGVASQLAAFQGAHYGVADQLARMVLTGLAVWTDRAEDPRRPDHLMYRQLLQQWERTMERARAAASGIQLPLPSDHGANGSGG